MKRIILSAAFVFISVLLSAQDSMRIEKGCLVWQKVYSGAADIQTIEMNLRETGYFRDFYSAPDRITAELHGFRLYYDGLGYKRLSLPIYIINAWYTAFVSIETKGDRYRVTLRRITFNTRDLGFSDLSTIAVNDKGEFSDKFTGAPEKILDYNFSELFSNLSQIPNDEW